LIPELSSCRHVQTHGGRIAVSAFGDGPPLLLLHGFPQSRMMWDAVASGLADTRTLIIPDLPGYGDSDPPSDVEASSKRAVAASMVEMMQALGYDRYDVAGHDRGARVAYRMALDHPERVARLAVLDILPTSACAPCAMITARGRRSTWTTTLPRANRGRRSMPRRLCYGGRPALRRTRKRRSMRGGTGAATCRVNRFAPDISCPRKTRPTRRTPSPAFSPDRRKRVARVAAFPLAL